MASPYSMQAQTLVNGRPATQIDVTDRALAYGHGLFETLLVLNGKPVFYPAHLQRLLHGCERLGIPVAGLAQQLEADLECMKLPHTPAVLKLILTCGSGGRGYLTPDPASPVRVLMLTPMPTYPDQPELGVQVRWCSTRLGRQPLLAGIKHLNRIEQVLARNEWTDPAVREGIVCDTDGWVIEGTMSNLCFIKHQRFCTPLLDQAGIEGIVRNQLLQLAAELGLETEQGRYTPEQVESADELLLCNSLIGIWPITRLGKRRYAPGPFTAHLQAALQQRMISC